MRRLLGVLMLVLAVCALAGTSEAAGRDPCGIRQGDNCGGVTGDQLEGDFHGLIMVRGQPDVLALAGRAGTKAGCGDCEWTLILACVFNDPNNPDNEHPCTGSGQPVQCDPGQSLFRLYLTTAATSNRLVDMLCLGGTPDVVPVGDIATADLDRYLRTVVPPAMNISVQPPHGVLAGLPTYFTVRPPQDLAPQPFGGPEVTERITITPAHYTWSWGDASADEDTTDAGAPYPDGTLTHTYLSAGQVDGTLTTRWGATYTITVAGQTFGPYDATGGLVDRQQPFALTVDAAHSHLVSGH